MGRGKMKILRDISLIQKVYDCGFLVGFEIFRNKMPLGKIRPKQSPLLQSSAGSK